VFRRWSLPGSEVDNRTRLRVGLVAAAVTLAIMAVAFALVAGLLIVAETVLLLNFWTKLLALAVMYLVPHFLGGILVGARYGPGIVGPVAAGIAPLVVLTLALGAFGGPVATVAGTPLVALAALVAWSATFACGQFVGDRTVAPRLGGRPGAQSAPAFESDAQPDDSRSSETHPGDE